MLQFDSSLFSGGGYVPSLAIQAPDPSSPAKSRGAQGSLPLTVKQIAEAYYASDDKSTLTVDGSEVSSVRLVGLVTNKVERVADISFTLDDGTGRININRWIDEFSDANEVTAIQNGMYVKVNAHLKGFQGKRHAFSVRPVTDFNDIVLHFIECIYVYVENTRLKKGVPAQIQTTPIICPPFSNGVKGYHAPLINQSSVFSSMDKPGNDLCNLVLGVFQEPAIMDAINHHVDAGHIYSTVDEYHFKSVCTG